ncbi:unnamed protein product [Lupinus luteus]|uniref:Uncharacterized protein n=1 Tax=Lupinus luteus TaxID=3873 RepID=A0AAV1W149_LUPLU
MFECTSCNLCIALQRVLLGMRSRYCYSMRQCVLYLCADFTVDIHSTIPPYVRVLSPL